MLKALMSHLMSMESAKETGFIISEKDKEEERYDVADVPKS